MKTMRLIVTHKANDEYMELHFTSVLQRAAEVVSASPSSSAVTVSDVADLWFPVPADADLFSFVERVLKKHHITEEIESIREANSGGGDGYSYVDLEVVYKPIQKDCLDEVADAGTYPLELDGASASGLEQGA